MRTKEITNKLNLSRKYIDVIPGSALSTLKPEIGFIDDNAELDKIAYTVDKAVTHMTGVVLPAIKYYDSLIRDSVQTSLNNIQQEDSFNVIPFVVPNWTITIYKRDEFKMINRVTLSKDLSIINQEPSVDVIRELAIIKTGNLGKEVEEYVGSLTDEHLLYIWRKYISLIGLNNENYVGMSLINNVKRDEVFIVFLLIRGLKNKAIDDNENVNNYVLIFNYLQMQIDNIMKTEKIQESAETVCYYVKDKQIYVNNRVYTDYLKNDGDVMAIIGATDSYKSMSKSLLKSNQERFISVAKRQEQNFTIKLQTLKADYYRYAIINQALPLFKYLKSEDDDTHGILYGIRYENIHGDIVKNVNKYKFNQVIDPIKICEDIVLNIIFKHTNAKTLFKTMQTFINSDSNISVGQAGTYATIELITKYMLTQVEVKLL